MTLKSKRKLFYNLRKSFALVSYITLLIGLTGCTLGNTYKAPEVKGALLSFTSENKPLFIPVAGAKIYHKSYPDLAVYSDEQGIFLLPTVIEVEVRLIMPSHSLTSYPIVIERKKSNYSIFVHSTLNSRYLEEFNLNSILLPSLENMDGDGIKVGFKTAWPCDLTVMRNLEQALETAKQLKNSFPNHTMINQAEESLINSNYANSYELLHQAENSCQWQVSNTPTQRDHILQTSEYLSEMKQTLKAMHSAQVK